MKSKLKLDLDEFNCPIIKLEVNDSEDLRDKVAKKFVEDFKHASNLCFVEFHQAEDNSKYLIIRPISREKAEEHINLMKQL